jgi:hypothetical protein
MRIRSNKLIAAFIISSGFFAMLISFTECKKKDAPAPAACFTSNKQSVVDSQIVTFNNCSSNASSYEWDFGDGTSSTISSPTKLYSTNGTYTVRMTASGNGKQSTATQTILVGDLYIDKLVINKLLANNQPAQKCDYLHLTFYSNYSSYRFSIDTSNITLPVTIPIKQQFKIMPGKSAYVDWYASVANYIPQSGVSFNIDRSGNNIHGYDDESISDMDIVTRIQ